MATDASAKQLPSDVAKFLHMSLKAQIDDLSEDAKKELGFQTPKEKIKEKLLNKAKKLSKDELVKFIQTDTTWLGK